MEEISKEEKEKINFIKKNIIERGLDPNQIFDFLRQKNSLGITNLNECSLSDLSKIINYISPPNEEEKKSEEKNDSNKKKDDNKDNKQTNQKIIIKRENDERFGVIIPEFINCQKNEASILSKYENVEIKIEGYKKVEKGLFSSSYYLFDVKTNPLNLHVQRKYQHFIWLRDRLKTIYYTNIVPNIQGTEEVFGETPEEKLEREKRSLERFLNFLIKDPLIKHSEILYDFLSMTKDNEFIKKKKKYDLFIQSNKINDFKSLNGQVRININDKKEKYLDKIKESINNNESILKKLNEDFVFLKIKMTEIINRVLSFVPLFENLININEKFGDHFINVESYRQIKSIFELWAQILKKQDSFFFYEINEYLSFILGNYNYMKLLFENTKTTQKNYYESSTKLLSNKRELFKKKDTLKWNLPETDIENSATFKKTKKIAYQKINYDETKFVIEEKQKYGFYLNRLISEYERLKFVYAKSNKDIIISFANKQQYLLLDYIQHMREIMGKMDECYIPEVNDSEELFELDNIKENNKNNIKDINNINKIELKNKK